MKVKKEELKTLGQALYNHSVRFVHLHIHAREDYYIEYDLFHNYPDPFIMTRKVRYYYNPMNFTLTASMWI